MLNKKGFTLIELLAVIVIISIIFGIAVPNVLGIINKGKNDTYIGDGKKMVSLVKYLIRTDVNLALPNNDELLVFYLKDINNGDITNDPDNGMYDVNNSYVVVNKNNGFDEYWVNLIGTSKKGISLVNSDIFNTNNKYNSIGINFVTPIGTNIATKICGSTTCKSIRYYSK